MLENNIEAQEEAVDNRKRDGRACRGIGKFGVAPSTPSDVEKESESV